MTNRGAVVSSVRDRHFGMAPVEYDFMNILNYVVYVAISAEQ